jgi:hypothetical protein
MNEQTKVALTKVGFAFETLSDLWIRVDGGKRTGIRFDLPGRVAFYMPDDNLPDILAALTTPTPAVLTEAERKAITWGAKLMGDCDGGDTLRDLLARSVPTPDVEASPVSSRPPLPPVIATIEAPIVSVEDRRKPQPSSSEPTVASRDFTDEELAKHEAWLRSKGRVVGKVYDMTATPQDTFTEAQVARVREVFTEWLGDPDEAREGILVNDITAACDWMTARLRQEV